MSRRDREETILEVMKNYEPLWDLVKFSTISKVLRKLTNKDIKGIECFIKYCRENKKSSKYITVTIFRDLTLVDGAKDYTLETRKYIKDKKNESIPNGSKLNNKDSSS